jgi:hypothetical protein
MGGFSGHCLGTASFSEVDLNVDPPRTLRWTGVLSVSQSLPKKLQNRNYIGLSQQIDLRIDLINESLGLVDPSLCMIWKFQWIQIRYQYQTEGLDADRPGKSDIL